MDKKRWFSKIEASLKAARKKREAGVTPTRIEGDFMQISLLLCELDQTGRISRPSDLGRFDLAWGIDSDLAKMVRENERADAERRRRHLEIYAEEERVLRELGGFEPQLEVLRSQGASSLRKRRARRAINRKLLQRGLPPAWCVAGSTGVDVDPLPDKELVVGAKAYA
jgi:hypothetical protein